MRNLFAPAAVLLLVFGASVSVGNAADWPHQRGPQINGNVAAEAIVPTSLPEEPRIVWRVPVTDGFAAPIVSNQRVI